MGIKRYLEYLKKNKKYIGIAIGVAILWSGAYAIGKLDKPKKEESPSVEVKEITKPSKLFLSPETVSVQKGSEFSIDAMIDPLENEIVAVELQIKFDNKKMILNNIEAEESAFSVILSESFIDNKKGEASIILGIPPTPLMPITDISKIATFVFLAKDESSDLSVEFTESSRAAARGELGNVINSRTSCRVIIQ